jgi:hypothetical protein
VIELSHAKLVANLSDRASGHPAPLSRSFGCLARTVRSTKSVAFSILFRSDRRSTTLLSTDWPSRTQLRPSVGKSWPGIVWRALINRSNSRYDSLVKSVSYLACDCNADIYDGDCAHSDLTTSYLIGALAACPYIESTLNVSPRANTSFQKCNLKLFFATTISFDRSLTLLRAIIAKKGY